MRAGALVGLFLIGVVAMSMTYRVRETEQVVLTRFGQITGAAVDEPGLHFKLPFIVEVNRFEKRWLEWDGSPEEVPTRDKRYIKVDAFARWRVSDPVKFFKRLRDETGAQSRLDDIIDGEIRNVVASHALIELVRNTSREFAQEDDIQESPEVNLPGLDDEEEEESADPADPAAPRAPTQEARPATDAKPVESDEQVRDSEKFFVKFGRDQLAKMVLDKASSVMPDYGIELGDVQFKRTNYVESVQVKVFDRMISERKRIAARYRSEGQGKSAEILGRIDRELKKIESEAYRKTQEIRGRADALATTIYAKAYNRDANLYKFLKTLETYEAMIDENTSLVLSTEAEILRYLKSEK